MGMIASWIFQVTTPLRELRWRFNRMRDELLVKLRRPQRMKAGIVSDLRQLSRQAGFNQKPKEAPKPAAKPPPKYPAKR